MDTTRQNIKAIHRQLDADLAAGDPKAIALVGTLRGELNAARASLNLAPVAEKESQTTNVPIASAPPAVGTLNTGVAGEYHVFSVLLRKGVEAYLTIGNTKAVDIVYYRAGVRCTIDVKTTAFDDDFIIGSVRKSKSADYLSALANPTHSFVFVSYLGQIDDPTVVPACYVVPATAMPSLVRITGGTRAKPGTTDPNLGINIRMKDLKASAYLHAWHTL